MKNGQQIGKHRAVIAINEREDISQAPEFKRLIEVHKKMNNKEKARTRQYIRDKISEEVNQ